MKQIPAILALLAASLAAHADSRIPQNPNEPLERLRATAFDPVQHELRELRARLAADPTNSVVAAQFARRNLDRYRTDADPRYLGRAQAALEPWWTAAAPPVEILVLRASIKQSQHQFTDALTDLETALRAEPRNAQAWLMRASVLTVLGDYAGARRACAPLARLAPGLIPVTAAANISALSGDAEHSCNLLRSMLAGNPSASAAEKEWAYTTLGEIYDRLGKNSDAETSFKSALALDEHDPYLLGAYADFLIGSGRPREAAELLRDQTRADGLLLRLALAESLLNPRPATYTAHVGALESRFEAGHLRGDFVHQREEARFELELLRQPAKALEMAETNWQVQHEPADIRIFVKAAAAAGRPDAAKPALDFVRTNHLEDITLK